ncbi:MAG: site-specific DNA-methyltransferase [Candidatus Omnitrophica bacterium]|nr:site-specific DNA-methyltransferase [Candidatus Omnitrophota bacterium]
MGRKKQPQHTDAAPVSSYKHEDKRKRIPTQEESAKLSARDKQPIKKRYQYDPSLDPQLIWSGKKEAGEEFGVSTVPIYVQEKIAPEAMIARLKSGVEDIAQMTLFGETAHDQFEKAVSFYEHEGNWQNRMILGDSLLVMNSLLEKEGLRGQVQTIYIDPPYGIKFGSNWQVSTRKLDVKDNKIDDLIRQPEQIKAFRDTWELGIHSYLSYLRDRLIASREMLTESGSCFVQISDENVHLIRNIMDEVFGSNNFVSQITLKRASVMFTKKYIKSDVYYVIWFAKNIDQLKYRQLFIDQSLQEFAISSGSHLWFEDKNSKQCFKAEPQQRKQIEKYLKDNPNLIPFSTLGLNAQGTEKQQPFKYNDKEYYPPKGTQWKSSYAGLQKLADINRLIVEGNNIRYKYYYADYPVSEMGNYWESIGAPGEKIYVVQTSEEINRRCIALTTDPGDLVLDPTCGSGTTAFVAEQWGRRWITIDTSRVALALARTRMMGAKFPYYKLKNENHVRDGFEYKTVPHITLKALANNEEPEQEVLYDQPFEDNKRVRVAGPFTVESLSPHRVSDQQEMLSSERFVETVIDNMLKAGVQTGEKGARVEFENLDILPAGPEVQAIGEYKTAKGLKKVAVSIGPEFGSIDDDFVRQAAQVAKKFAELLIVAGTSFEAAAFAEPSQVNGLQVMKVKINPDLSMGDLLKKTGTGNLFIAFGEPDVRVKEVKDGIVVEIVGVDVYDPVKSEIRSSGSGNPEHDIATWFIDANYNGEAFFVTHAYFLGGQKPYEKLKKALKADIDEEAWNELYSNISRPFPKPKTGKVAIKVINHYGDEVMKIVEIR